VYLIIIYRTGTALLNKFGGSVAKLVADVYPTHNWEPDKFHNFVQKQTSVNSTAKAVMAYGMYSLFVTFKKNARVS